MAEVALIVGTATGVAIIGSLVAQGARTEFEKWTTPRTSSLASLSAWRLASGFWDCRFTHRTNSWGCRGTDGCLRCVLDSKQPEEKDPEAGLLALPLEHNQF